MAIKNLAYQDIVLIYSGITGRPYIDSLATAHAFLSTEEESIRLYCQNNEKSRLYPGPPVRYLTEGKLASVCYAAGAEQIEYHYPLNSITSHLQGIILHDRFYNHDFCKNSSLVIESGREESVQGLARSKFIVPVQIQNHEDGAVIHYASCYLDEARTRSAYIGFSDLPEYEEYAKSNPGFQPLYITVEEACRIGESHGYMVNPGNETAFWISPSKIEMMREYLQKEEKT